MNKKTLTEKPLFSVNQQVRIKATGGVAQVQGSWKALSGPYSHEIQYNLFNNGSWYGESELEAATTEKEKPVLDQLYEHKCSFCDTSFYVDFLGKKGCASMPSCITCAKRSEVNPTGKIIKVTTDASTATYEKDGIRYSASNHRMCYNPEFHENHNKPFTTNDLIYLCSNYETMDKATIALALGRTHSTILSKAYQLRKAGQFEYYKSLGKTEG